MFCQFRERIGEFLPVILSRKEAHSIVGKVRNIRHAACLTLIYACGLRISEGCAVKVTDIDRERMQLHVLPSRFCKVRHYGLHHSSKRATIKLLQSAMSFALGRDLPKPPEIEQPPTMTCPKCAAIMVFEQRYNRCQRLAFENASARGPPQ